MSFSSFQTQGKQVPLKVGNWRCRGIPRKEKLETGACFLQSHRSSRYLVLMENCSALIQIYLPWKVVSRGVLWYSFKVQLCPNLTQPLSQRLIPPKNFERTLKLERGSCCIQKSDLQPVSSLSKNSKEYMTTIQENIRKKLRELHIFFFLVASLIRQQQQQFQDLLVQRRANLHNMQYWLSIQTLYYQSQALLMTQKHIHLHSDRLPWQPLWPKKRWTTLVT